MFVLFLATPTIVSVVKKSSDTSIFFSMAEEEQPHQEIKAELKYCSVNIFHFEKLVSSLIVYENLSKHDNVSSTIFIPPPELV